MTEAVAILFGLLRKMRSTRELEEAARKQVDFMGLFEGHTLTPRKQGKSKDGAQCICYRSKACLGYTASSGAACPTSDAAGRGYSTAYNLKNLPATRRVYPMEGQAAGIATP